MFDVNSIGYSFYIQSGRTQCLGKRTPGQDRVQEARNAVPWEAVHTDKTVLRRITGKNCMDCL